MIYMMLQMLYGRTTMRRLVCDRISASGITVSRMESVNESGRRERNTSQESPSSTAIVARYRRPLSSPILVLVVVLVLNSVFETEDRFAEDEDGHWFPLAMSIIFIHYLDPCGDGRQWLNHLFTEMQTS